MNERENARRKAAARKARERRQRNRRVLLTVGLMLAVCVASIGGTIAWLTDKSDSVTNTFTHSDITVSISETGATESGDNLVNSYKMVPGNTITKDPKVTIKAGSEKSWVFVEIEESSDPKLTDYISYTVAEGWTKLTGVTETVYYRIQDATTADVTYSVLSGDKVTVNTTVTKSMMENIDGKDATGATTEEAKPTLSFTAYAVQYFKFEPAAETDAAIQNAAKTAWDQAKTNNN